MNVTNFVTRAGKFSVNALVVTACLLGSVQIGTYAGKKLAETDDKIENIIEAKKDRIATEEAIRAEGIQARSYWEAKEKLDSIRFNRMCKEQGVSVPVKPKEDAPEVEHIKYKLECLNILNKGNIKILDKIAEDLDQCLGGKDYIKAIEQERLEQLKQLLNE